MKIRLFSKNDLPIATVTIENGKWDVFAYDQGIKDRVKQLLLPVYMNGLLIIKHLDGDNYDKFHFRPEHPDFLQNLADFLSGSVIEGIVVYAKVEKE